MAKGLRTMTRYRLRFAADDTHAEETREYEKGDGAFVFWLAETGARSTSPPMPSRFAG